MKLVKKVLSKLPLWVNYQWNNRTNGIYCFNYHRIGNANNTCFDPNIFSASELEFTKQLKFYQQHFKVISVDELLDMVKENKAIKHRYAIITFDDGYIDNYEIAYPILQQHGLSAAFYIATDYIDLPQIPWWDEIAWLVRHSKKTKIKLKGWSMSIDISKGTIKGSIQSILKLIKQEKNQTMTEKIKDLESYCQCKMPDNIRRSKLFLNWPQIKEMSENGMHIGSHTLSHRILSHLTEKEQHIELTQSKQKIEGCLNKKITTIAYPVGDKNTFTTATQKLARQANYQLAFSYISGINKTVNHKNQYQLNRFPVFDGCSIKQLKSIIVNDN